ncbi:MAG: tyrosine-type recombinase/integrase [Bradymonadaceae bacterium]
MSTQGWKKTRQPGIKEKDGRYRIRVAPTGPDGRQKQKQKTLPEGLSLEEAIEARKALEEKAKEEAYRQAQTRSVVTVGDYVERWTARKAKQVSSSTFDRYETEIAQHILPWFDDLVLDQLERRDVSDWIWEVERAEVNPGERYSTSSVQSWWRTLRMILQDAHAEGYLPRDVTSGLQAPNTGVDGKREQRTLTADQLGRLVEKVGEIERYAHRRLEVATLAYTGIRASELYGLTWDHVDVDDRRLEICQVCVRGELKGRTKTDAPRTTPMPASVAEGLRNRRKAMMRNEHPGLKQNLVFPAEGGQPRYGTSIREVTVEAAKQLDGCDVHVTPQVLRRTFNTLMLDAKVSKTVLWSMIGHNGEQMSRQYAGVSMDQKRSALEAIAPNDEEVNM